MNGDDLTDTLCANLAVPVGALTGEGPQCVDALLAWLTVVLLPLALIDICVSV